MSIQLSDLAVIVNSDVVGIVPNSLKYTEGFGEQTVRTMSIGSGAVEQIFANDLEDAMSKIMFDIPTTVENVELARKWKAAQNANVVQLAGKTSEGTVTKTFTQAALTGDYEVEIGADTNISLEWMANAAI